MDLISDEEGLEELMRVIPAGEEFGVSRVQRDLRWGYCRAQRVMERAIERGQATRIEGARFKFE